MHFVLKGKRLCCLIKPLSCLAGIIFALSSVQVVYFKTRPSACLSAARELGGLKTGRSHFLWTITSKQLLAQTSRFTGKPLRSLFSPQGKNSLVFTVHRLKEREKNVGRFKRGRGGCWNRKCSTAVHPSLNPDVNSSERTSSRQHAVLWAWPPGGTRTRFCGKPAALKSYHCRVRPRAIYWNIHSADCPLSPPPRDTDSEAVHKIIF